MAKIRVYELARDLSMENKALLEKLAEMKVDVKSHMSSLDDEIIAQVKDFVLGKKKETVVETRVKSTVIRRRVKLVTVKKLPAEPVSEAAEPADVEEIAEQPAPEAVPGEETPQAAEAQEAQAALTAAPSVEPIEEPAPAVETIAPPTAIQPATPPLLKKGKPAKATKKAKKDAPAKIIKLPSVLAKKAPEPEKVPTEPAVPVVKEKIDRKPPGKKLKGETPPLPIEEEESKGRPKRKAN